MSDHSGSELPTIMTPEGPRPEANGPEDVISSPAKVLRIGAMTKELLEEVRRAPMDEAGRTRLREIYETSVRELGGCLSDDLRDELARLSSPFNSDTPSEAELRVAQAQLVGWLEGVVRGIQNALRAQSGGRPQPPPGFGPPPEAAGEGPPSGTYL